MNSQYERGSELYMKWRDNFIYNSDEILRLTPDEGQEYIKKHWKMFCLNHSQEQRQQQTRLSDSSSTLLNSSCSQSLLFHEQR